MILANISKIRRNTKRFSCLSTFDYFIKKADLSRVGNALAGIVSHLVKTLAQS